MKAKYNGVVVMSICSDDLHHLQLIQVDRPTPKVCGGPAAIPIPIAKAKCPSKKYQLQSRPTQMAHLLFLAFFARTSLITYTYARCVFPT